MLIGYSLNMDQVRQSAQCLASHCAVQNDLFFHQPITAKAPCDSMKRNNRKLLNLYSVGGKQ